MANELGRGPKSSSAEDILLWAVAHDVDAEGRWKEQWRWNKALKIKVDKVIVEQNKMAAKVVGASLVGGAVVALLGLLAAFGLKLF